MGEGQAGASGAMPPPAKRPRRVGAGAAAAGAAVGEAQGGGDQGGGQAKGRGKGKGGGGKQAAAPMATLEETDVFGGGLGRGGAAGERALGGGWKCGACEHACAHMCV